jgi:hypothetical protein
MKKEQMKERKKIVTNFFDWMVENNIHRVRHNLYSYKALASSFNKKEIINMYIDTLNP